MSAASSVTCAVAVLKASVEEGLKPRAPQKTCKERAAGLQPVEPQAPPACKAELKPVREGQAVTQTVGSDGIANFQ